MGQCPLYASFDDLLDLGICHHPRDVRPSPTVSSGQGTLPGDWHGISITFRSPRGNIGIRSEDEDSTDPPMALPLLGTDRLSSLALPVYRLCHPLPPLRRVSGGVPERTRVEPRIGRPCLRGRGGGSFGRGSVEFLHQQSLPEAQESHTGVPTPACYDWGNRDIRRPILVRVDQRAIGALAGQYLCQQCLWIWHGPHFRGDQQLSR